MKIKTEDAVLARSLFQRIAQQDEKTPTGLPAKVRYSIIRTTSKLTSALRPFEHERDEAIKKYGKKDEKGHITADADNADFNAAIEVLADKEIEVDVWPIPASALQGDNVRVPMTIFTKLMDLGFISLDDEAK